VRHDKVTKAEHIQNDSPTNQDESSNKESAPTSQRSNDASKTNYKYFSALTTTAKLGGTLPLLNQDATEDETVPVGVTSNSDTLGPSNVLQPAKPSLPRQSLNLAAYVNQSETLSNLVKLGVDLSKVEQDLGVAEYLVKLDYERGVRPHLDWLHGVGVTDSEVGGCVTRAAGIFQQSLDNLQVRVNYLESKRFTSEDIARIVTKAPDLLCQPVKYIDTQLGTLQRLFKLTGDEVRLVATKHPKIVSWNKVSVQVMQLMFRDCGFTDVQQKQILLAQPKLYLCGKHAVMKRFDYLTTTIGYTHSDILHWPQVLRTRLFIIRQRHQFLSLLGRSQFDATKENYVSLKLLVLGKDADFCRDVAKVNVKRYNEFLKTL
jgi:hypothetical protein